MSKYAVKGSDELDARIDADLKRITDVVSPCTAAGILLGGYGRGEGTPLINPDGSQSPFNDYDLVVVVDKLSSSDRNQFRKMEQELSEELGLDVDLCPYEKKHLPNSEFSLLNYEMKHGHRVVWGDERILDAMPGYPPDAIPLSEGTRLMLNRGKLLLDVKLRLADPEPLDGQERIRLIKFISKAWLALGDCALLDEGKYDISYRVKRERILSVGDIPNRADVVAEYRAAIDLKEWGDYDPLLDTDFHARLTFTRGIFTDFFGWYRTRHSARECAVAKAMLLNLKWYRWPYFSHPRARLYHALPELLKDSPDKIVLGPMLCCSRDLEDRFYQLQARFS